MNSESLLLGTEVSGVRLQGVRKQEECELAPPLSSALLYGLSETRCRVQNAALEEIYPFICCGSASVRPTTRHFYFILTSLSLSAGWARQNYVPCDNYPSKLLSEKWRRGEIAYEDVKLGRGGGSRKREWTEINRKRVLRNRKSIWRGDTRCDCILRVLILLNVNS